MSTGYKVVLDERLDALFETEFSRSLHDYGLTRVARNPHDEQLWTIGSAFAVTGRRLGEGNVQLPLNTSDDAVIWSATQDGAMFVMIQQLRDFLARWAMLRSSPGGVSASYRLWRFDAKAFDIGEEIPAAPAYLAEALVSVHPQVAPALLAQTPVQAPSRVRREAQARHGSTTT